MVRYIEKYNIDLKLKSHGFTDIFQFPSNYHAKYKFQLEYASKQYKKRIVLWILYDI